MIRVLDVITPALRKTHLWPPLPVIWILESDPKTQMMYQQCFADKTILIFFATLFDALDALTHKLSWPNLIICNAKLGNRTIERFVIDARKMRFSGPMIAAVNTSVGNTILLTMGCNDYDINDPHELNFDKTKAILKAYELLHLNRTN